ncbi:MAG: F0F1 ATP synthase subunit B [Nostocaceae cyanobacterium]|nr:F0F1 ATP synthase subunit B [Nostocaceae cyanobacterium]
MEIDLFTFIAQIVNFLILVVLLLRFLYRPIVQAMDRREETIRDRLLEADAKRQTAQQEAERYQQMQQELKQRQQQMLAEVKAEVEKERAVLMQQIREEVEATRSVWQTTISRQQDAFLRELRYRATLQIKTVIRRVLRDIADVNLEKQIIETFITRIQNLSADERQQLSTAIASQNHNSGVAIYSAFEIPPDSRQKIIQVLRDHLLKDVELQFETTPHLICGIELRATGQKLAWSLENYLDTFEENLSTVFKEETGEKEEVKSL